MKYRIKKEILGDGKTRYEPQLLIKHDIFGTYMFGTAQSLAWLTPPGSDDDYESAVEAIKRHQSMQVIETEYITEF